MKMRSKQKAISNSGVEFLGQSNVMKCIRNFYSLLYKKGNYGSENEIDDDFFQHCPISPPPNTILLGIWKLNYHCIFLLV